MTTWTIRDYAYCRTCGNVALGKDKDPESCDRCAAPAWEVGAPLPTPDHSHTYRRELVGSGEAQCNYPLHVNAFKAGLVFVCDGCGQRVCALCVEFFGRQECA